MCLDFSLNIVLREFLENEQVIIKVNTMQALRSKSHCGMQFELDALIWLMLYVTMQWDIDQDSRS